MIPRKELLYFKEHHIIDEKLYDIDQVPELNKKVKAVVACGNGTAGIFAPDVLRGIGCEVVELDCKLDWTFPKYNPNPEDLEMLHAIAKAVKDNKADIGFGFDGDGDRVGVIDNKGNEIFSDKIGLLIARNLSTKHNGSKFIVDVKSTGLYSKDKILLENKIKVWCAEEDFSVEGEYFSNGSIVIRNNSNKKMKISLLKELASEYGINIFAINTALATEGPDLGSSNFTMFIEPRIAIVSGPPTSTYSFGATWHLIDYKMKSRASLINAMSLAWQDLSKYNVLILPNGGRMKKTLGDNGIKKLKNWINDGGTLISYSNSAAFLSDSSVSISSVRLRRQSLDKLDIYANDLSILEEAKNLSIDSVALWEGGDIYDTQEVKEIDKNIDKIKELDQLGRKFRPQGAILKVNMDEEHWLSVGCRNFIPVLYNTGNVFMAKKPVNVAGRLADEQNFRLGGLLWPEAKSRIAESAWVTQERHGKGQVILFATEPHFRGYFKASERVLLNAIYLGPGMGTSPSVNW